MSTVFNWRLGAGSALMAMVSDDLGETWFTAQRHVWINIYNVIARLFPSISAKLWCAVRPVFARPTSIVPCRSYTTGR